MTGPSFDNSDDIASYRLRRGLSLVLAQVELLSAREEVSHAQEDGLERIRAHCYELEAAVEDVLDGPTATAGTSAGVLSRRPAEVGRVLVLSRSAYLESVLGDGGSTGGIEWEFSRTVDAATEALNAGHADLLLVDAVLGSETGLDATGAVARRVDARPPFGLVSVRDGAVPTLGLSGLLDPRTPRRELDSILGPYASPGTTPDLAGLLTELPETPLGERLGEHDRTVLSSNPERIPGRRDADIVCLDRTTYRNLTAAGALQEAFDGQRPALVLLESTESDPRDRSWIPTVGGAALRGRPLELAGLTGQVLAAAQPPEERLDV